MEKILLSICVLSFSSTLVKSQLTELFYNGFSATDNITLDGDAEIQNGRLRLTSDTTRLLGHAFYSSPIRFKSSPTGAAFSFSACFAIAIVPEYPKLGGHGLAFVISQTRKLPNPRPSQYLGLLNPSTNGNSSDHIFFIEFDTVQDFEFDDINDNHVGIDISSMTSNASAAAAFFDSESKEQGLNLTSGKPILAWVEYDARKNQLNVTISPTSQKPNISLLSFDLDLSPILNETMFVGFSASTGLLASTHYVLGWSLKMNGEAKLLDLTSLPKLPGRGKSHRRVILGVSSGIVSVIAIAIGIAGYLIRKIINADVIEDWELQIGPHRFSYEELKRATKGFRDKELLGFGGFGRVYRGMLPNSNGQVAVKRISHESKQGLQEFVSEIASIGRLRHRNLVHLLGWCRRRGDLILVYEFMANGSLDKYLFDEPKTILNWEQRFTIMKGVASGLLYLHEEWEQTVIHRDIKSGNVLLDSDLNGRLGDFGLAKLYERGSNPSTTRVVGTLGYLAPELTRTGRPTTGSDVFAFGALLLEVVCGRRPIEPKAMPEELVLVEWVWERWSAGAILSVVDTKLNGEFAEVEVVVALKLGLMCSNNASWARPTMRQVVRYLDGEVGLPEDVPAPDAYDSKSTGGVPIDFEDYIHSYPNSSIIEQASMFSSGFDDPDIEAGR